MTFQTYLPPSDLAPFIEHFWTIRWDEASAQYYSDEVMHRPHIDVIMSSQQSNIPGTFRGERTCVAAGSGRIIGSRFRLGVFHAFWHGTITDLQDKVIGFQQVIPQIDARYSEHLLALDDRDTIHDLRTLVRVKHPQPDLKIDLINEIITAIKTDDNLPTVSAVAKAISSSERWLLPFFQVSR